MNSSRSPLSRLASGAALSVLVTLLAVPLAAAPAYADPPVTVDDTVEAYAGSFTQVDVLSNDSDPDGPEDLTVCRVKGGTKKVKPILESETAAVFVSVGRRAKPGEYTFTYYACDYETLVPGTVTVTVLALPKVKVTKIASKPGRLKVKNPADSPITLLYGSFREGEPDGILRVRKNSSKTFKVRRTKIDWVAFGKAGFVVVGHVKNIKLPPGTKPPTSSNAQSQRSLAMWRRHR